MKIRLTSVRRRRGSALGTAMILALAIAVVVAGLVRWSHTERELSLRHVARAKTQMVAESVDQYGAAQIKARLEKLTYFPDDEFRPGHNPPELPPPVETILGGLLGQGNDEDDGGLVGEVLQGVGGLLGGLLGGGNQGNGNEGGNGNDEGDEGESPNIVPPTDGYFRYEITPDNLVVGRFKPARWETAATDNPLYVGDPLVDQMIRVREVRMVSSAKAVDRVHGTTIMAYCESYLQVRDSPIWGNVFFYNMDLEIAPGAAMEIHGPVHTNGNLYVQSDPSVQFHDMVTAAGYLYHGRAPGGGSVSNGSVRFKKRGSDEFVSLFQDGDWLDSHNENWMTLASTLWAGNVRTREHGINPAYPAGMEPYRPDDPATEANELDNSAHVMIEPATPVSDDDYPGNEIEVQKFASSACLVFEVDDTGTVKLYKYEPSSSGTYIRDVGSGPAKYVRRRLDVPSGLIIGGSAADKFYDKRRGLWVRSLDLDVGRLKELIEQPGEADAFTRDGETFDPQTEWNGIVYVEHKHTSRGGVRLVNGEEIPSLPTAANGNTPGFTFATDAPLYVLGNYNANGVIDSDGDKIRQPDSADEPPAGLAADAVTILSNAWTDEHSDQDLGARRAQQTEVAAALLTGIVPTNKNNNGRYSGGVENLPRFLEDWSGVKFGYRGSMSVLYESERATEPWGSSNVYSAPTRVWGFNQLFANGIMPPGTPSSRTYRRIGFRDLTAAEYEAALQSINQEE